MKAEREIKLLWERIGTLALNQGRTREDVLRDLYILQDRLEAALDNAADYRSELNNRLDALELLLSATARGALENANRLDVLEPTAKPYSPSIGKPDLPLRSWWKVWTW